MGACGRERRAVGPFVVVRSSAREEYSSGVSSPKRSRTKALKPSKSPKPVAQAKKKKARRSPQPKVTKRVVAKARKAPPKRPMAKAKATRAAKPTKVTKRPTKKVAIKRVAPKTPKKSIVRRDGTGHLDPAYAAKLRELGTARPKEKDRAFFSTNRSGDDLAEELGEEVVSKMTSGEDEGEDVLDQHVTEEDGGPFVTTTAKTEFAHGTDASNPSTSKREPFPTT